MLEMAPTEQAPLMLPPVDERPAPAPAMPSATPVTPLPAMPPLSHQSEPSNVTPAGFVNEESQMVRQATYQAPVRLPQPTNL